MCAKHIQFPYEIRDLEAETNAELLQYFHGERTGYVKVGPEGYFFPTKFKTEAEHYYNFQARPDDIWIVTFPRSGTTWTQELIWLVANKLDFETAAKTPLTERFPFFEFDLLTHSELKVELQNENAHLPEKCESIKTIFKPSYKILNEIPHNTRRFIKTHLPFSLLPPSVMQQQCKIIYVARQPMDVAVSYYHLHRLFRTLDYKGDFARFWDYFERGLLTWTPYHSHIKEALAQRNLPNMLLLHYEQLKKDLSGSIAKVADFLNCALDAEGMDNLLNHLAIENFRLNNSVNMHEIGELGIMHKRSAGFVRSGGHGEQKEFTENSALLHKAKKWVQENSIKL